MHLTASSLGRWCAVIATTAWLFAAQAVAQDEERRLVLAVGETAQIPSADIASFSSTGLGIVEVTLRDDAAAFLVEAFLPGETVLLFIRTDGTSLRYRVRVLAPGERR
jgi:hypothetical protein